MAVPSDPGTDGPPYPPLALRARPGERSKDEAGLQRAAELIKSGSLVLWPYCGVYDEDVGGDARRPTGQLRPARSSSERQAVSGDSSTDVVPAEDYLN